MSKRNFEFYPDLINSEELLNSMVEELEKEKIIGIDTEFIREKTFYPIIALIQVATKTKSWLIDPISLNAQQMVSFLNLLKNKKIMKVFHAAQADQECFFTTYNVIATPMFDTAVGASLLGFGESPGLSRILKEIIGVNILKGHARTDWKVRPLPSHLIKYAHQDVAHLIDLTEKIFDRLESKGRKNWALELSSKYEDPELYEVPAEELTKKMAKSRGLDKKKISVLNELVRWREKRVRELDLPRKWVADDDLIVSLANVSPLDMEHLSSFRGLNKGELKHSGELILSAIKTGIENPLEIDPAANLNHTLDDNETRALELIQCFIKILAEKNEIAPKLLISNESVIACLRSEILEVEDFVRLGIMTEGASKLIGKELLAFLNGQMNLRLAKISGHLKVVY